MTALFAAQNKWQIFLSLILLIGHGDAIRAHVSLHVSGSKYALDFGLLCVESNPRNQRLAENARMYWFEVKNH
jgi:hypothetical protein